MSASYLLGLVWILIAGVTQGAFPLPMKFVRRWKWEHLWLVYSVIAFFILPLVMAWATVPHLGAVLAHAGPHILWPLLFAGGTGPRTDRLLCTSGSLIIRARHCSPLLRYAHGL